MKDRIRGWLRGLIALLSVCVIIYFQRETGKMQLLYMLGALAVLLLTLFDYNYQFNHPKRDK